MKYVLIFAAIFGLLPQVGFAATSCYTPPQFRAEQAIRFHTKLMVTGLYCKKIYKEDSYATYQAFTNRNQAVIRTQENILIKVGKTEKALHSLRTDLANKTSLEASKSIIAFCQGNKDNYQKSRTMQPADFKQWIEKADLKAPSSKTLCAAAPKRKK